MVAAVATLEPDAAAKRAQVAMLAWMRPPGSQPTQLARLRYIRSATPLSDRISPSRTKSGMAMRMYEFIVLHTMFPTMLGRIPIDIASAPKASMTSAAPT